MQLEEAEAARRREIAAKQRRRLSLAPDQVGDTSKMRANSIPGDGSPQDEGGSKRKLGLRVAYLSRRGVVPFNRNKVNQDRYVVADSIGGDEGISLFGVMDGHGEFGHLVAEFVKVNLPIHLSRQKALLRSDPYKAITLAVERMCMALEEAQIEISFSGTTAVFGVLIDDVLYVANVGDSRCVLASIGAGAKTEVRALSNDHKPSEPVERARILQANGRVCPLPGHEGEDRGPDRVWLPDSDVPGLAMSRSIGDEVSRRVGVISIPEIIEHRITNKDLFAVWASDGVWEFLSNEEAVSAILPYINDNPDESARNLVQLAHKQWVQHEEVVDDITCVIVQFNATPTALKQPGAK